MKNTKRLLTMLLIVSMLAGTASMPVYAEGDSDFIKKPGITETEEADDVTEETIENEDGTVTELTAATRTVVDELTGETTVIVEFKKETDGVTDDGTWKSGKSEGTKTTVTDSEGNLISSTMSESGSEKKFSKTEGAVSTKFTAGSETSVEIKAPELTVDVPLTDKDDPDTEKNEAENTVNGKDTGEIRKEYGDLPESPEDGTYDYITETIVTPGKVTVNTTDVTIEENAVSEKTDMKHAFSGVLPDAYNDLVRDKNSIAGGTGAVIPTGKEDAPKLTDGYEYVHLGTLNGCWCRIHCHHRKRCGTDPPA